MKRLATWIYGVTCYLIFFATFLYTAAFLANYGVPKSIDSGAEGSFVAAVVVNFALIALFGVQHTVMARPRFKRVWTRIVPRPVERSTYVLASSLALAALFWLWQPMTGSLWTVENEAARNVVYAGFGAGIAMILYATFLIDHFDLFGLRQVWLYWCGEEYTHKPFETPGAYKWIRHPLYVGWFVTFWATPDMTEGHLLFAGLMSAYILAAIVFEERDLLRALGRPYREYRDSTPMFVPSFGGRRDDEDRVVAPHPAPAQHRTVRIKAIDAPTLQLRTQ